MISNGVSDLAINRCAIYSISGGLHEFWSSSILNQDTKIRLYKCTVWSKLTYGCVAWKLTEKTRRFLRSWNARNLFRITGRDIREETKDPTAECDLEKHVRSLRLKWVGHILRKDESFPARRMLMNDEKRYEEGSVLMDAPKHDTMEELAELAIIHVKYVWFWSIPTVV